MRLFILDDLKITKYSLPKNINETYLIHYQSDFSYIENTITIEVNSGQWQLVSNGSVDIIEKEIIKPIAILSYFQYYNLNFLKMYNQLLKTVTIY